MSFLRNSVAAHALPRINLHFFEIINAFLRNSFTPHALSGINLHKSKHIMIYLCNFLFFQKHIMNNLHKFNISI